MSNTFDRALHRNLSELQRVQYYRNAYGALRSEERDSFGIDVFELMKLAFFDQMFAHAIKVFEKNRRAASFWFLFDEKKDDIESFCRESGRDLRALHSISRKLRSVRNGTHFHIDSIGVLDPETVWSKAGIIVRELDQAVEDAVAILQHCHERLHGKPFSIPAYDGSDVRDLVRLADEHDLVGKWLARFEEINKK